MSIQHKKYVKKHWLFSVSTSLNLIALVLYPRNFYLPYFYLILTTLLIISKYSITIVRNIWSIMVALTFFMCIYGKILGFSLGNNTYYLLKNNFGVIVYFSFFTQYKYITENFISLIMPMLRICLFFSFFYIGYSYIQFLHSSMSGFLFVRWSIAPSMYFFPVLLAFGTLGLALQPCLPDFIKLSRTMCITMIILYFMCLFLTQCKGMYFFTLFFFMVFMWEYLKVNHKLSNGAVIFIMLIVFIVSVKILDIYFSFIFVDGTGNSIRHDLILTLIKNINLIGHGSGSTYSLPQWGRVDFYGSEVSYLNLIYDYGIFSIFFFILMFSTLKNIFMLNNTFLKLLLISLLSGWFVAIGNPVLFSPIVVLLHCVVIIILSNTDKYKCSSKAYIKNFQSRGFPTHEQSIIY